MNFPRFVVLTIIYMHNGKSYNVTDIELYGTLCYPVFLVPKYIGKTKGTVRMKECLFIAALSNTMGTLSSLSYTSPVFWKVPKEYLIFEY